MGSDTLRANHFMFSCLNNDVKYEALVHGLNLAKRMGNEDARFQRFKAGGEPSSQSSSGKEYPNEVI